MMKIDMEDLDTSAIHNYYAFASDLGIRPGEVPREFKVPGLGNGLAFVIVSATEEKFTYDQCFGCVRIVLFND